MATKSHVVLVGSKRKKDPTATKIGKIDPKEIIDATVSLAGPKLPSADEYVGKTLTAKEFKEQYASSKEDADKVAKSLKKFGLKIDSVSLVGRSMRVSGTVAAMEKAFKAGMVLMHSPLQGDYRGREGTLQIPAELKGLITGVFGLDERQMAKRKSSAAHASQALAALTPADLEKRYNFPAG